MARLDVSREETRRAVLAAIGLMQRPSEARAVMWLAANALGYDNHFHPGKKFEEQVKRCLDDLAKAGTLVKVKGRDHCAMPTEHGWITVSRPMYFIPGHYRQAVEMANTVGAERVLLNTRRRSLAAQAASLGLEGIETHQPVSQAEPVVLSVSDEALERLLVAYRDFQETSLDMARGVDFGAED